MDGVPQVPVRTFVGARIDRDGEPHGRASRSRTYVFDVTTADGSSVRGWPHTIEDLLRGGPAIKDRHSAARSTSSRTRSSTAWARAIALLIGVIITAFFIPNMLRKGSVDLIISKPIGRTPTPRLQVHRRADVRLPGLRRSPSAACGSSSPLRSGYWDPTFLARHPGADVHVRDPLRCLDLCRRC